MTKPHLASVGVAMDGECLHFIKLVYGILGRGEKGYNLVGVLTLFALFGESAYIVFKAFFPTNEKKLTILHFISLIFFYCGTTWVIIHKRSTFLNMAKECDTFVGLDSEHYRNQYKKIRQELQPSKMRFGSYYMSAQTMGITSFIACRPLLRHFLLGAAREFVISGYEDSNLKFWLWYAYQMCFMLSVGFWIPGNTLLYMRILLHITCKYHLLNYALSNMKYNPTLSIEDQTTEWDKTAKACAMHYSHILR